MSGERSVRVSLGPWAIVFVTLVFILLFPVFARAEMPNNLSNAGCKSCHTDYPGTVSPYVFKHSTVNCTRCHTSGHGALQLEKMWNCRYCHLTTYQDTYVWPTGSYTGAVSGFKSYRDPLRGAPLGSELKWMGGHFAGGALTATSLPTDWPIDANFTYHTNSPGFQHNSVYPDLSCQNCHQSTLTSEHEGKTKVHNNPAEDFEDGSFRFNFTGYWGGDWARVNETAYTGSHSFKSGLIGVNLTSLPYSTAATETSVNVDSAAAVSFWYKVTSGNSLKFYIDGTEQMNGTAPVWTYVYYPLAAGSHTVKWSTGGNSAYIDDLSVSGASTTYTIDCNTCHLSSDTAVKDAIANHNDSCAACHTLASGHEAVHMSGLDDACQQCHQAGLTQEHINNPTTAGKNYNCSTCHASTVKPVNRAIMADDLNCAGCHALGHNINFVDNVPADIPLHPGFKWSTPMEASLFTQEPDIPAGYETGLMALSNRRTDISAADIWAYYNEQLGMNGWVLQSPAPETGGGSFTAGLMKETRSLTLKCYNSRNRSGSGPQTGSRIELWYMY